MKRALHIRFNEYNRLDELSEIQVTLVDKAKEAAKSAYAPYSNYYVGAAVLLGNGEIITGNNQENAAYPSGLCAERVAIFYANSQYPDVPVTSIAIVALKDGSIQDDPVTPCGGCRQVLCEKESQGGTPMEVILCGKKRIQVIQRATDLLPLPFILKT
ncbi:MAG: cytidine deaminase [Bacteroidota bacterium]